MLPLKVGIVFDTREGWVVKNNPPQIFASSAEGNRSSSREPIGLWLSPLLFLMAFNAIRCHQTLKVVALDIISKCIPVRIVLFSVIQIN